MENIIEVLNNQVPFLKALSFCVFANTLCGGLKHTKLSDFNWKELLIGALRYIGICLVILCLVIACNIYEPLYTKYLNELAVLEEEIVMVNFVIVINQVYKYWKINKELKADVEADIVEDTTEDTTDEEAIG